mmetsp:Transcript_27022/g.38076  ORF Transcript_27022/g.38076 Transcript_27022/m.38076 type:complete len:284 (-) Transcript_27022:1274-2125(-)
MQQDEESEVTTKNVQRLNDTKTPIWQAKAFELFVKTVLITEIVEPNQVVCEFYCNSGLDLGKIQRAKVAKYVGVDSSLESLNEAKERWKQKKEPFAADFVQADVMLEPLNSKLHTNEKFDHVICFNGLQKCFENVSKAKQLFANVNYLLKSGGFFFGIVPDSSAIWYKAHRNPSAKAAVKGEFFSIEFQDDSFAHFGSKYTLKLEGCEDIEEYLVHFPSLIRLAREFQIEMVEIINLLDFLEENAKKFADIFKSLNVLGPKGKFEQNQKDVVGLYTCFVFQKT